MGIEFLWLLILALICSLTLYSWIIREVIPIVGAFTPTGYVFSGYSLGTVRFQSIHDLLIVLTNRTNDLAGGTAHNNYVPGHWILQGSIETP